MRPDLLTPVWHWAIALALCLWGLAYAGLVTFAFAIATPEHYHELVKHGRINGLVRVKFKLHTGQ